MDTGNSWWSSWLAPIQQQASNVYSFFRSDPIQTPPLDAHASLFPGPNWPEINRVMAQHPESAARMNEVLNRPAVTIPTVTVSDRIRDIVGTVTSPITEPIRQAALPLGLGLGAIAIIAVIVLVLMSRR